jgi:hypothetical protein
MVPDYNLSHYRIPLAIWKAEKLCRLAGVGLNLVFAFRNLALGLRVGKPDHNSVSHTVAAKGESLPSQFDDLIPI